MIQIVVHEVFYAVVNAYVDEMSCNQLLLIGYAMYVYASVQFASCHNIALSLYDMCACVRCC